MNRKQVLEKAIEKAVKNGWDKPEFDCDYATYHNIPEFIIYRHDFAKAFFGCEDLVINEEDEIQTNPAWIDYPDYVPGWYRIMRWERCLKEMVLEEDPIEYLRKFL